MALAGSVHVGAAREEETIARAIALASINLTFFKRANGFLSASCLESMGPWILLELVSGSNGARNFCNMVSLLLNTVFSSFLLILSCH